MGSFCTGLPTNMADKQKVPGFLLFHLEICRTKILGLGLHLQALAQLQPSRYDLHQPHRRLASLTPYEHLHRILRLCDVHAKRNIRSCAVSEDVRNLMRSLTCMTHHNWDGTIQAIEELGGKAGLGENDLFF